ncbi:hypothetical protein [Herbaspirillum sp. VT-16-41]|uniref:hypothetical protein n=1 Tax=Herbaspirillum sp. VT-16-41 TaxID=1953765 RepID=UPI0009809BED|nr:hypothetical protein [Herbaspirillum sp. VT-16-41]ONN68202.1 hypothetical protein BTM36_02280 [Herbaspirillum sp. VT-16-41]
MMLRAKILLLWLLALAIPLQGFAAVLQACAPAMQPQHQGQHHAGQASATAITAEATPADPADQAAQHHSHHHPMAQTLADSDPTPASPHGTQHANASCSFCAACTVGAILPLALATVPAPDLPSHDYLVQPASGFVGYLPENPDRPPALA